MMISRPRGISLGPPPSRAPGLETTSTAPSSLRPTARNDCRIALFSMNDGEYQSLLRQDCMEATNRFGFAFQAFDGNNDAAKQVDQIHACLARPREERPTVVMVSPVREVAVLSAAYAAARAGVGFVILMRSSGYLDDLREEFPNLPIFAVLCDQREVGRIQGRFFKSFLPEGGEVVYIRGPLGTSSAVSRFEGVQEVIQDAGLKLYNVTSDWTCEGGKGAMAQWLQILHKRALPRFVVGAQNDAMAMGAREALEEFARQRSDPSIAQVPIVGCDGSPQYGQRLVRDGRLAATVIMPPAASVAVVAVAAMLNGRAVPAQIAIAPVAFPAHVLTGVPSSRAPRV